MRSVKGYSPTMKITIEMLCEKSACGPAITTFADLPPDGIDITEAACLAEFDKWDWDWAAQHLLNAPARAKYARVNVQARTECNLVNAKAWAECKRVKEQAWAEYQQITAKSWAERKQVNAKALTKYKRRRALAFARLATQTRKPAAHD